MGLTAQFSKETQDCPVISEPLTGVATPPISCLGQVSLALAGYIYLCCSDGQRYYGLGKAENKLRPGKRRNEGEGSFCLINKPCMPNFTLILSLPALPFCKHQAWEKQKAGSTEQGAGHIHF